MLFIYSYRTLIFFIQFLNGNIFQSYMKKTTLLRHSRRKGEWPKAREVKEASGAGFVAPAPVWIGLLYPSCILWSPFIS